MSNPTISINGQWRMRRIWWWLARISLKVLEFSLSRAFKLKIESGKWERVPIKIDVDITNV